MYSSAPVDWVQLAQKANLQKYSFGDQGRALQFRWSSHTGAREKKNLRSRISKTPKSALSLEEVTQSESWSVFFCLKWLWIFNFHSETENKRILLTSLVKCTRSTEFKVWARFAVSISYDDNHYTTGTCFGSLDMIDSWNETQFSSLFDGNAHVSLRRNTRKELTSNKYFLGAEWKILEKLWVRMIWLLKKERKWVKIKSYICWWDYL